MDTHASTFGSRQSGHMKFGADSARPLSRLDFEEALAKCFAETIDLIKGRGLIQDGEEQPLYGDYQTSFELCVGDVESERIRIDDM